MKFTNALSIFTAPFPLPFMGEDAGEAWTCKQYLVMISVRPKGVAVDEDITPSFRFQCALSYMTLKFQFPGQFWRIR